MPSAASQEFIRLANHPLKLRLFLLSKLPAAFFSGVRIREMNERSCKVSVPYRWGTQNPFRSTYFACLAMAAELSTGALAMSLIYKRKPGVSMLIVKMESEYFKKATGRTYFTCEDGEAMESAVEAALRTGEPQTFRALSVGLNDAGEKVAEFHFTWSFKAKIHV